jgi:electron transport complex protein RnfG
MIEKYIVNMEQQSYGYRKYYPVIFTTVIVIISVFLLVLADNAKCYKLNVQQDQNKLFYIKEIFPKANFYDLQNDIYTVYNDRKSNIGYAFYETGQGFGGKIVILVGLEDKYTISGIKIISHNEMGDWDQILNFSAFNTQFIRLNIYDCNLKKNGGTVDGISGATISSNAVVDIVRDATMEMIKSIR